jgi:pyruvate/2-oxoglutarate dehydrogenase complex dihydrolipoamide dehydrogenase (E3) component
MAEKMFDLAVIGAGAAGLSVTAVAAQLGLRVALIERGKMGGDCLNTGCVPSKALLAAAHAVTDARDATRFGVRFAAPEIDWTAVRDHVKGVIAAIAPIDSQERFQSLGATVMRADARFSAPDTLIIGGEKIAARKIVIAAGSRAVVPPIPGLAEIPFLTHETLFDLPEKPSHLLILGGGPIGLEMAQAFSGLGCQVSVVEAATIAGREDTDLVDVLRTALTQDGVKLFERAAVARVAPGPTLILEDGTEIAGSHLLVAVGRTPNLESLDLPAGNVAATRAGIATDAGLRSLTNKRVFAAGDIADPKGVGPRWFTHVGGYHAGIVIRRALFHMPAKIDYAALPRVTYTAPELAQVGLTESEARAAGVEFRALTWPLTENDRAQCERRTAGIAKLIVTSRGKILGAGICAPHAGEMIGAWTLAIARKIPLSAMAGMILPYPTLAEAGKRAAGTFFTPKLFSNPSKRLVALLKWLP